MPRYRTLDADKIIETVETLRLRIEDRFPESGLAGVCRALFDTAQAGKVRSKALAAPHIALRVLITAIILLGVFVFVYIGTFVNFSKITTEAFGLVQGLEAALNSTILAVLGVLFLVKLEERLKRRRALHDLHELRSIVHVIDMHQLTKDPSVTLAGAAPTAHSPVRTMTDHELTRYLDYCTEMLSLTGKVAALYAQHFRDPVVVTAVNDIEDLSTHLARKIWQKIMILHRMTEDDDGGATHRRAGARADADPLPERHP
ncbi:MAG: hypothetical protein MI824_03815 [Hyphomicrobiales bacterium]|nr:hypothetical protein [Hyphomicrobiales bacterium]